MMTLEQQNAELLRQNAELAQRWIGVDERLPNDGAFVVVRTTWHDICGPHKYNETKKCFVKGSESISLHAVTHWINAPESK